MTAAEAATKAAQVLERAEEAAGPNPAGAQALTAVADGWTRLAVAITQNRIL